MPKENSAGFTEDRVRLLDSIILARQHGVSSDAFEKELERCSAQDAKNYWRCGRESCWFIATITGLIVALLCMVFSILLMLVFDTPWAAVPLGIATFAGFTCSRWSDAAYQASADRLHHLETLMRDENALILAMQKSAQLA